MSGTIMCHWGQDMEPQGSFSQPGLWWKGYILLAQAQVGQKSGSKINKNFANKYCSGDTQYS